MVTQSWYPIHVQVIQILHLRLHVQRYFVLSLHLFISFIPSSGKLYYIKHGHKVGYRVRAQYFLEKTIIYIMEPCSSFEAFIAEVNWSSLTILTLHWCSPDKVRFFPLVSAWPDSSIWHDS